MYLMDLIGGEHSSDVPDQHVMVSFMVRSHRTIYLFREALLAEYNTSVS